MIAVVPGTALSVGRLVRDAGLESQAGSEASSAGGYERLAGVHAYRWASARVVGRERNSPADPSLP